MNNKGSAQDIAETSARLWRFADYELDELRRELRVKGRAVELEAKPLDILLQLVLHAGEVVTKEELLEAVWPDVMVVDGSLATAVSKLRKAMGDEDHPAIVTVPRVGYRLAVPVYCKAVAAAAGPELGFKAGDVVPGREQWRLTRSMDISGSSEVWLAENPKTHEQRAFKFAADGARLKGLKREITISRFLRESLGDRPEFVRILEWNFETPPFFLESEYAGPNLAEWAVAQGGLSKITLETRLHLLIDIAQAVAAAHDLGVLHKDLKPANILVVPGARGGWQIKIADFGSASLFDPSRLHALGITNLGFTQTTSLDAQALTGTTRAQSEGSLGLWDDAIRDDLTIHELAVRKQGPLSFFAVVTLSDGALAQCRAGRYREGESNARQAYEASTKAFGPRAGLTGGTASTLADCLIGLDKLDEASKLLDQVDVPAVAQLAGDPEWGAGVTLAKAEIAYRRGNYGAARNYVQTVTPVYTRANAEPFQKRALESLRFALDKPLPRKLPN